MFRTTVRRSRPVIVGVIAVALSATGALAGTIHAFAVSQTTGSEGAVDFLQTTVPGGALQGETGPAASTGLGTPFGVFGKYGPPSGTTTVGLGVVGISTQGWGVTGESLSGYPALYAFPNAKDGIGLDAESDNKEAIYAEAHGNADGALIYADGIGYGVYAYSAKGQGIYVEGGNGDGLDAYADNGGDAIYGQSNTGYGVYGYSSNSDGVHAEISNGSSGVAGINDGNGNGVYGRSDTGFGAAAFSVATPGPAPTGNPFEYAGTYSQSQSGPGIYGVNAHNTGSVGTSSAYNRYAGVFGYGYDGAGVYGYSNKDIGIIAESSGSSADPALFVEVDATKGGDEIDAGSGGVAAGKENFAVSSQGDEYLAGSVTSNVGTFAVTQNPRTDTVTYGAESTEPMVEDVGSAHLVNGTAAIALAGDFRQTIQDVAHYMVFLTPYGDASLYVASRTPAGFVVRETHGGHSTLDFDYRIVAERYGVQTGRLPHLAALSPRMAQLRLAALHPNTNARYANASLGNAAIAPPIKVGSNRAALLAKARHASAATHRQMTMPPEPPPGFLAGINR